MSSLIIRCPVPFDRETRDLSVIINRDANHLFNKRINIELSGKFDRKGTVHMDEFINIDKCLKCKFGLRMILGKCSSVFSFEQFGK